MASSSSAVHTNAVKQRRRKSVGAVQSDSARLDATQPVTDTTADRVLQQLEQAHNRNTVIGLVVLAVATPTLFHYVGTTFSSTSSTFGLSPITTFIAAWIIVACYWIGRTHAVTKIVRKSDCTEYERLGVGSTAPLDGTQLYLDSIKRSVMNIIYQDAPGWYYGPEKLWVVAPVFDLRRRLLGEDAPPSAHTMIGWKRLCNLQHLIQDIVDNEVPGDIVETGVLRGGAMIFAKACLRAFKSEDDRRVYACDTFQNLQLTKATGLAALIAPFVRTIGTLATWAPAVLQRKFFLLVQELAHKVPGSPLASFPKLQVASQDAINFFLFVQRYFGELEGGGCTEVEDVKDSFARYGLLDDRVVFLKGYFSDTLPTAPIEQVALLRLDGDTYESTITVLEPLYPKLAVGGYVIVDDFYSYSECRQAIEEYRAKHHITSPLIAVDNLSVYWQKTE